MTRIYKIGLVIIRDNKLLLCEPFAYSDLILPGGTKEGNETPVDNLLREIFEELGEEAALDVTSLKYLGNFEDVAAGRIGRLVEIELYIGAINGNLIPSSEIKRLHWFSSKDDTMRLSPIIRNKVLPYLIKNNYLYYDFSS
jgi:8-oxo-dGTP pyrophosphatase MutT (NUDIX family)